MANWFVKVGTEEQGPFVDAQLRQFASSGQLRSTMLVRREGGDRLVEAGAIRGLFPSSAPPSPPITVPVPPPPPPISSPSAPTVKHLQMKLLPAAERAIGAKALQLSISTTAVGRRYVKLRAIEGKIAKAETDVASARNKFEKITASATLKSLRTTQSQLQEEVGRIIRLAPSLEASRRLAPELAAAKILADQLAAMGGKPKYHAGPAAIAVTLIIVVALAIMLTVMNNSPDNPQNWGGGEGRKSEAMIAAQDAVANALNFPNEADFPWGGYVTLPLCRELPYWSVSGKVTGKNAFGVSMTTDWRAEVYLTPDGNWECLGLTMGNDTVINRPLPVELKEKLADERRRLESKSQAEENSSSRKHVPRENTLDNYSQIPPPVITAVRAGQEVWELDGARTIECKQSMFYVIVSDDQVVAVVIKYWAEESFYGEERIGWQENSMPTETKLPDSMNITLRWSAEDVGADALRFTYTSVAKTSSTHSITKDQFDVEIAPDGTNGRWTKTYSSRREASALGLVDEPPPTITRGQAKLLTNPGLP